MKISWPGGSGTGIHKFNNDDEAKQFALKAVSRYPLNAKCEIYRLYDDGHEQYVGAAEHTVRLCL